MDKVNIELAKFKEELFLVSGDVKNAYYERALNKIHELIVNHPNRAEPYYELGKMSYNFWRNEDAEENYLKALKADPNYFPTYTQYSLILIKEGRFDEALSVLENSRTLRNREDSDIYFYMGMLYQHQGNYDEAIQNYTLSMQHAINENQLELGLKFVNACKEIRGWD